MPSMDLDDHGILAGSGLLRSKVFSQIENDILTGKYKPGESLTEMRLSEDMKVKKAMEFVRSNATVTDAAPETAKTEKKPAAKKTATKKTTAEKAETPKTAAKKTATKTTAKKPTAKKEAKEEAPEADEKA